MLTSRFAVPRERRSRRATLAAGVPGNFTPTLPGGVARTLYFADRPDRVTGVMSTAEFLEVLASIQDDPPNAALVAERANGAGGRTESIWIVTLLAAGVRAGVAAHGGGTGRRVPDPLSPPGR